MTLYTLEILDRDQRVLESFEPNAFDVDHALVVSVPVTWTVAQLRKTLDVLKRAFPARQVILINDAVRFLRLVEVPE